VVASSIEGAGGNILIASSSTSFANDDNLMAEKTIRIIAAAGNLTAGVNTTFAALDNVTVQAEQSRIIMGENSSIATAGSLDIFPVSNAFADMQQHSAEAQHSLVDSSAETVNANQQTTTTDTSVFNSLIINSESEAAKEQSRKSEQSSEDSGINADIQEEASNEQTALVPVAFTARSTAPVNACAQKIVKVGENHYSLLHGAVLIHSNHNVVVDLPHACVKVKAGAVVLLSSLKGVSCVRNFSDNHRGDVSVQIGSSTTQLAPGREVSIVEGKRSDDVQRALGDGIARRSIEHHLLDGVTAVNSDFSIIHAMLVHPLLKQARSSRDPHDKLLIAKTMKTAAAVSLVIDKAKGPYGLNNR
jgi:hypothetical protein